MCRIKSAAQHLGVCGMCSGKWPNKVNYLGLGAPNWLQIGIHHYYLRMWRGTGYAVAFPRPLLCWRNALQLSEQKMKQRKRMWSSFFLAPEPCGNRSRFPRNTCRGKLAVTIVTSKSAFFGRVQASSVKELRARKQRNTVDEVEVIITHVIFFSEKWQK